MHYHHLASIIHAGRGLDGLTASNGSKNCIKLQGLLLNGFYGRMHFLMLSTLLHGLGTFLLPPALLRLPCSLQDYKPQEGVGFRLGVKGKSMQYKGRSRESSCRRVTCLLPFSGGRMGGMIPRSCEEMDEMRCPADTQGTKYTEVGNWRLQHGSPNILDHQPLPSWNP